MGVYCTHTVQFIPVLLRRKRASACIMLRVANSAQSLLQPGGCGDQIGRYLSGRSRLTVPHPKQIDRNKKDSTSVAVEAEPEAENGCRFAALRDSDADIYFLLWLVARAGRVLARRARHVAGLIVRRFRLRRRRSLASHRPWGGVYKDASGWLSFFTTTTTTASTRRFLLFGAFPRVAC